MISRRRFIKNTAITAGGLATFPNLSRGHSPSQYFIHGVASGDPLSSKIIIWTRLSNCDDESALVTWQIAADISFSNITQSGKVYAAKETDYTLKIDIANLQEGRIYYYQFNYMGYSSPIGKTKTIDPNCKKVDIAVVSCSDYSAGYYNALANIAVRKELDAVLHLGDYIYEGKFRNFAAAENPPEDLYESTHFNRTRNWWLHYYRSRYAINRLDADMQAAHHAHPFITIWDDHEIANNAWHGGAPDHNVDRDGDWEVRKSAAKQAYAEWMPIRSNAESIYRSVQIGNLAELILLDTRIEGRDKQVENAADPARFSKERTILGQNQKRWLLERLNNSPCQWKLIASQVIFSSISIAWANLGGRFTEKIKVLENTLLDYWEGYPAERAEIIEHINHKKINNVVILSASMHCSLALDVPLIQGDLHKKNNQTAYDPVTGKGSIAVEFAAPSITSANFDEKMEKFYANMFQSMINKQLPAPLNYNPNPHLKFADLQKHGYYILKLSLEKAEAQFFFVDELLKKSTLEKHGGSWLTKKDHNRLQYQHTI